MDKTKRDSVILFEACGNASFPDDFLLCYHSHIFCHKGNVTFDFNGKVFQCKAGEFIFWFAGSRVANLVFSKGFKSTVLLVESDFLNSNIPDQSRGLDATLHSKEYPVLYLNDKKDRDRILLNFQLLNDKYLQKTHRFYNEALKLQMRLFILEMWHTFSDQFERRRRTIQSEILYEQFIHLVQENCKTEREVQFYAQQLHITSKHLNHICKSTSGSTASDWIQRYVKERLELLLQNTHLNMAEIADEMEFSSRSFFTRYVKNVLGVTPSEYRNRMK